MKQLLDDIYDYILQSSIAICFIGAILFIITSLIKSYKGYYVLEYLINASILFTLGIILSFVFIKIKSHAKPS